MGSKSTFTFQGTDKVTPELQKINKSLDQFETGVKKVGGAIAGYLAVDKLVQFGTASVKAFAEADKSANLLKASLATASNSIGLNFVHLRDLADQLELSTGTNAESLQQSMVQLQSFGNISGDVFEEAIKQSVNLTGVWGSQELAIKQLGEALADPINGLQKLDKAQISFTDTEKKHYEQLVQTGQLQTAQLEILDKVKAKYDGIGESLNSGVNGGLNKFSKNFGDVLEATGESIYNLLESPLERVSNHLADIALSINATNILSKVGTGNLQKGLGLADSITAYNSSGNRGTKEQDEARRLSLLKQIGQLEKTQGADFADVRTSYYTLLQEAQERYQAGVIAGNGTETTYAKEQIDNYTNAIGKLDQILQLKNQALNIEKQTAQITANTNAKASALTANANAEPGVDFRSLVKSANQGEGLYTSLALAGAIGGAQDIEDIVNRWNQLNVSASAYEQGLQKATETTGKFIEVSDFDRLAFGAQSLIKQVQDLQEAYAPAIGAVSSLYSTVGEIEKANDDAKLERQQRAFDRWKEHEEGKIAILKANGQSTAQAENDYIVAKEKKQAELDAKIKSSKKKEFESNKLARMAGVVMATAEGVAKSLPNLILAGTVGAIGATELAIVASQKMPAFANGGIVPGNSYTGDNIVSRLNSGEMVLTRNDQMNLISQIRSNKSSNSGTTVNYIIGTVNGSVDEKFISQIEDGMKVRSRKRGA